MRKEVIYTVVFRICIHFKPFKQTGTVPGCVDGQKFHDARVCPEGLPVDLVEDLLHLPVPYLQIGVDVARPLGTSQ